MRHGNASYATLVEELEQTAAEQTVEKKLGMLRECIRVEMTWLNQWMKKHDDKNIEVLAKVIHGLWSEHDRMKYNVLDGSDTSMSGQLEEAGFGPFGPM